MSMMLYQQCMSMMLYQQCISFLTICRVQRRVSFADSVGLDLASIRIMTEGRETPPYLESYLAKVDHAKETKSRLQPLFVQPIANFSGFLKQLTENGVSLESVEVTDSTISGTVKVQNMAFEKCVRVRFTTDDWKSHTDHTCYYVNPAYRSHKYSAHDSFAFKIEADESWRKCEFCICYTCQGSSYWDNNKGANYKMEMKPSS